MPAAANLKPKHDQAAPPAAVKLGVSLPALAQGSCAHSNAWLGLCAGVRSAVPRKRADKLASTASRVPCQSGRPLHTTSMR